VSKFRPPRRSGWRAPWIPAVLAVLIAAALAGVGAAAGAQEADPNADQSASVSGQGQDGQDRDSGAGGADDSTTTTAAEDDDNAGGGGADDSTTTTAAEDDGAGANGGGTDDTPTTTAAGDDNAGGGGAVDNSNFNDLPLNSGVQTGTVFNPTPYGEVPAATPQVLVLRPGSGRIIPLNREIQLRARFSNFRPGTFSDPQREYGQGTQRLDENGFLNGHNHACIQRVARDGSVPGERCDSFVVMQQEGGSDILTGIGPPLTQPGRYRVCIDAAAGNHYPAARAFAQRGGPVDCVRVLAMSLREVQNVANQ
jgi:hypothetical protein